jgi:hypothetical protein
MKLVILVFVVLMVGFFVSAELGDDWGSFDGDDNDSFNESSTDVNIESSQNGVISGNSGDTFYTFEFYVALGVGGFGILVVIVFLYFFFRKPKNRWKKSS